MDLVLKSLPKAELHVHLEGSIRPATLQVIAPQLSREEIDSHYQYDDFLGFLKSYAWVAGHLTEPAHFGTITTALLDELRAQGCVYAELNLSAGVMLWRNQDVEANFQAIEQAAAAQTMPVRYIFDAVRQFGVEHAGYVADWAVRLRDRGVVGFGVGGDESRGPVESFKDSFALAHAAGLHLVPHAGEAAGPESVWRALELGAERIGHGIRSIDDPALVAHLATHNIPLEISITSNLRTGTVSSLLEHPVRRLFDAGVPIVLNTDDPAMFHTTLLDEYELARRAFGFSDEELRRLAGNSLRYAFKP